MEAGRSYCKRTRPNIILMGCPSPPPPHHSSLLSGEVRDVFYDSAVRFFYDRKVFMAGDKNV
jgi:hypothetical protein